MHKAWCGMGEVPYSFSRTSVKFQGHTRKKSPIWTQIGHFRTLTPVQFGFTNSFEMLPTAWRSIEEMAYCLSRSFIKFHDHTGHEIHNLNPISIRSPGRSQLSNPSDLHCSYSIAYWPLDARLININWISIFSDLVLEIHEVVIMVNSYGLKYQHVLPSNWYIKMPRFIYIYLSGRSFDIFRKN